MCLNHVDPKPAYDKSEVVAAYRVFYKGRDGSLHPINSYNRPLSLQRGGYSKNVWHKAKPTKNFPAYPFDVKYFRGFHAFGSRSVARMVAADETRNGGGAMYVVRKVLLGHVCATGDQNHWGGKSVKCIVARLMFIPSQQR